MHRLFIPELNKNWSSSNVKILRTKQDNKIKMFKGGSSISNARIPYIYLSGVILI